MHVTVQRMEDGGRVFPSPCKVVGIRDEGEGEKLKKIRKEEV